jgi:hypothetical protein
MTSKTLIAKSVNNLEALAFMGLNISWLEEISLRILTAYNRATPNDAIGAAGTYAYLEAIKALRDVLISKGWSKLYRDYLELTRNPDNGVNLIVSSGDKNTGLDSGIAPKTKNPKGVKTQKIVDQNSYQPFLWKEMEPEQPDESVSEPTWVLLYHLDKVNEEMRIELSLPTSIDLCDLKVDEWETRILLPSISFNLELSKIKPDFAPEIEFGIKRKSNEQKGV